MSMDYVEKVFSTIVPENKEVIEFEQFVIFIRSAYVFISDERIDSVFIDLKINKNAPISVENFKKLVNEFQDRHLKEVFLSYDENKDGLINISEMYKTLKQLDSNIKEEHMSTLIAKYDLNGDGCMDFEEFKKMLF